MAVVTAGIWHNNLGSWLCPLPRSLNLVLKLEFTHVLLFSMLMFYYSRNGSSLPSNIFENEGYLSFWMPSILCIISTPFTLHPFVSLPNILISTIFSNSVGKLRCSKVMHYKFSKKLRQKWKSSWKRNLENPSYSPYSVSSHSEGKRIERLEKNNRACRCWNCCGSS